MTVADAGISPASQNELQTLAFTDPLTGLGNRYRFREKVRQLITERAEDPAPFTICIANLDGFKPINDLFGPSAGDQILCQVAHRLKACIPDGATVVRYEGDEFAFLFPLVFERRSAEKTGMMLKEVLSAPYDLGERNVRLSASFGFSSIRLPARISTISSRAPRQRSIAPSAAAAARSPSIPPKSPNR
jgi:diguanylate cyclase (GGDEF)-like protein